jgi:hypothetical protein
VNLDGRYREQPRVVIAAAPKWALPLLLQRRARRPSAPLAPFTDVGREVRTKDAAAPGLSGVQKPTENVLQEEVG